MTFSAFCARCRKKVKKAERIIRYFDMFAGSNTRRGRVGKDVAHTLQTSCIQGIVARSGRVRRLMLRECFRLQGFSEDQIDKIFAINSDAQAYKQAGNSVTVTVIEAIGRRIRAADAELYAQESR